MSEEGGEDRTEAASPKRLEQARREGRTALSPELAPAAVLLAVGGAMAARGDGAARTLALHLAPFLEQAHALQPTTALRGALAQGAAAALPMLAAAAGAGILAVLAQTGALFRPGAVRPDPSRVSPAAGLRRLLSGHTAAETAKGAAKLAACAAAAVLTLRAMLPDLAAWPGRDLSGLVPRTAGTILRVLAVVVAAQGAFAFMDLLRARQRHAGSLRMTRHELREEAKESDGDPHLKARLRRVRAQRARRRVAEAVPKASVVVTNPTHYAVALAYERGATSAPRVVAKGVDTLAARIRDIAAAHRVPVVANPPLARALYPLELDAEIPRELYQAVAELIAYVWRLTDRTA